MKKVKNHLTGTEIKALQCDHSSGISRNVSMVKFNISRAAYYRLIKSTTTLKPMQKKIQKSKYDSLNNKVFEKFREMRGNGVPISGPAIQFLALSVKRELLSDPTTSIEEYELY